MSMGIRLQEVVVEEAEAQAWAYHPHHSLSNGCDLKTKWQWVV